MTFHRYVRASEVDRYMRISTTALWRENLVSIMGFEHAGDVFIWSEISRELAQDINQDINRGTHRETSPESNRLTILDRWQVSGIVGFDELSDINEEASVITS
jgi:hypothetical protein